MIKKTLFKAYIEIINYNTFTTIFLFKKTIRMSTNKLRCYSQESFRRELIKRDQHCILSGLSAEVSEAAHIVNKEYLETDNKELRFTKQNGILLNSCLQTINKILTHLKQYMLRKNINYGQLFCSLLY